MKIIKDSKNKLLIHKIKKIEEIISSSNPTVEDVYEVVIDFILVFEHVIQKILYSKNKLLIYEFNLDINKVNAILKNKKHTLHTIQLSDLLSRYINICPKSSLSKEGKSIEILINNRNILEHDINIRNILNKGDLLKILINILPIFLPVAEKVLGTLPPTKIKKEEGFSEQNIQNIYDKIVLSKISNYQNNSGVLFSKTLSSGILKSIPMSNALNENISFNQNIYSFGTELCPRCGSFSLSKKDSNNLSVFNTLMQKSDSDLYNCSSCNLELTKLEYDAVERLKKEHKLPNSGIFS